MKKFLHFRTGKWRRFHAGKRRLAVSRRAFLASSAGLVVANRSTAASAMRPERSTPELASPLALNEVDRQIWEEELDQFVPKRLFDVHCHIYRRDFNLNYQKESARARLFPDSDLEILSRAESIAMPRRVIRRLAFPSPFRKCDFEKSNEFVASEMRKDSHSAALMLVHPSMSSEHVEKTILRHTLLGLKPYRRYCIGGDIDECRITDFLPEHQVAIANRYGLIIMLHLSMKKSVADPRNIEDLLRLSQKYPDAKWILAHCARSYAAWAIEKAAPKLGGIPNIWYEVSSVCEMEAFDALFSGVGVDRVLYGADSPGIAFARGKSISYAFAWGDLTPQTNKLDLAHCDGRMTFYIYEQLRAMRRASLRLGLTQGQIENMFFNTANQLVQSVADAMRNIGHAMVGRLRTSS